MNITTLIINPIIKNVNKQDFVLKLTLVKAIRDKHSVNENIKQYKLVS